VKFLSSLHLPFPLAVATNFAFDFATAPPRYGRVPPLYGLNLTISPCLDMVFINDSSVFELHVLIPLYQKI
jgi:hypothetical protein